MTPLKWILGNDTGISSRTIFAVMVGEIEPNGKYGFDIPHDPSDFGRCYRLLKHFPKWRSRLPEVAEAFPKWGPLVREWDKLEALYEVEKDFDRAPKLYKAMKSLYDECMECDGWVKTSLYCWEKKA